MAELLGERLPVNRHRNSVAGDAFNGYPQQNRYPAKYKNRATILLPASAARITGKTAICSTRKRTPTGKDSVGAQPPARGSVHPRWRGEHAAIRKLQMLHAATRIEDLRVPPGNRLEALKGNRKGQYSIRINGQWRICFRFGNGKVTEVEIVDYH